MEILCLGGITIAESADVVHIYFHKIISREQSASNPSLIRTKKLSEKISWKKKTNWTGPVVQNFLFLFYLGSHKCLPFFMTINFHHQPGLIPDFTRFFSDKHICKTTGKPRDLEASFCDRCLYFIQATFLQRPQKLSLDHLLFQMIQLICKEPVQEITLKPKHYQAQTLLHVFSCSQSDLKAKQLSFSWLRLSSLSLSGLPKIMQSSYTALRT